MAEPMYDEKRSVSPDEHHLTESGIEPVSSEVADLDSSPPNYEIVTYPADFTLEGIVAKFSKGQIGIPGFQRKFVWTIVQASKLIELKDSYKECGTVIDEVVKAIGLTPQPP